MAGETEKWPVITSHRSLFAAPVVVKNKTIELLLNWYFGFHLILDVIFQKPFRIFYFDQSSDDFIYLIKPNKFINCKEQLFPKEKRNLHLFLGFIGNITLTSTDQYLNLRYISLDDIVHHYTVPPLPHNNPMSKLFWAPKLCMLDFCQIGDIQITAAWIIWITK